MTSFLKSIFGKGNKKSLVDSDKLDSVRGNMSAQLEDTRQATMRYPDGFDKDKPTIIILDDSAGATMLFDDDIRKIQEANSTARDMQFLKISTPQAVFMLKSAITNGLICNIKGAVLDITIGGYAVVDGQTVILDGIDAYRIIRTHFPHAVMRFFTSHSMNEKNAEIYKFMKKYEDYAGECISKKTYMKNPFTTNRMDMLKDIVSTIEKNSKVFTNA
jgi:hypothetical protein